MKEKSRERKKKQNYKCVQKIFCNSEQIIEYYESAATTSLA